MDPNVPGFPSAMQQTAGFPVTPQNPQQFPYYPNAIPPFPQSKAVSHPPQQQHQHTPFGAVPMQAGPSGAMMPSGFPQQSSATCASNVYEPVSPSPGDCDIDSSRDYSAILSAQHGFGTGD
ncbi:hypothetical protein RIB2604_02604170 [Aspergillus luchuensis]|uniref:Uncharacterized protein n=1 Tax=Aspergillus kawachii TaxID=1069201 RepID=A0A146FUM2_ASPKA|nr:hypothetical protein RIB2604_02604170 [Aspergillus luchuensis]